MRGNLPIFLAAGLLVAAEQPQAKPAQDKLPRKNNLVNSCHCLYSSSAWRGVEAALLEYKQWHQRSCD